jgi:hypothetical protein
MNLGSAKRHESRTLLSSSRQPDLPGPDDSGCGFYHSIPGENIKRGFPTERPIDCGS